MSTTTFTRERPDSPDASQLIQELDDTLDPFYPSESRHGYSVDKIIQQGVHFFVLRHAGQPAGCGGVQFYGNEFAELKRMYVRADFRGKKFGKLILTRLADYARQEGVGLLRLETGIYQESAIAMYENFGFYQIEPFGDYFPDPLSRCYEKRL